MFCVLYVTYIGNSSRQSVGSLEIQWERLRFSLWPFTSVLLLSVYMPTALGTFCLTTLLTWCRLKAISYVIKIILKFCKALIDRTYLLNKEKNSCLGPHSELVRPHDGMVCIEITVYIVYMSKMLIMVIKSRFTNIDNE